MHHVDIVVADAQTQDSVVVDHPPFVVYFNKEETIKDSNKIRLQV